MLSPGTRLENFEIVGSLGAGGFGVTYKARDVQLGNFVAIKEYFPEQFARRDGDIVMSQPGGEEEFEHGRRDFFARGPTLSAVQAPQHCGSFEVH